MDVRKTKLPFWNKQTLPVLGIIAILLLAAALLWYGNANSWQANPPLVAQVYFDGEYRIADGPWHRIVEGEHIPSTKGDVTLRGNFHILTPYGEYVGIFTGGSPLALYANHISLTICEPGFDPDTIDTENPLCGISACSTTWVAYSLLGESEEPIEIRIHNPHSFGNENAIDDLLANVAFWTEFDFEKDVLSRDDSQRSTGIFFMIISTVLLGIALFSTLIHIKNGNIFWLMGLMITFAGCYLTYSVPSVEFWSDSLVSNTIILGLSMMFYMLFLSLTVVHTLKSMKSVGSVTVTALGAVNILFLALPMLSDIRFYDTWFWWVIVQGIVNAILMVCLIKEAFSTKEKDHWLYIGLIFPLIAFFVDAIMTYLGIWEGGVASTYVFIAFFIVAMIAVLQVAPHSINALAKAKELETEKIVLHARLTESQVSTMMSQIRPHFIYNTLGSIEQLCYIDPPKAGSLVHNFAKYLRGNLRELDNPKPILMSQEMEHVRYYVNIENVRFPDMTFAFEMNSNDFHIPALTIQPIVENAIKHGLMKLPKGGRIRVVSYETDTHHCVLVEDNGVGFDTSVLLDERKHVGIRNIRGRLQAMVNGELEIESTVGVGTKVLISIPKEVGK